MEYVERDPGDTSIGKRAREGFIAKVGEELYTIKFSIIPL